MKLDLHPKYKSLKQHFSFKVNVMLSDILHISGLCKGAELPRLRSINTKKSVSLWKFARNYWKWKKKCFEMAEKGWNG